MQTDKTSKHVLGTSELTCLIPIRRGFISILDTRTYATRLLIAVRLLNSLRVASREVHTVKPIVDAVDAIRGIHSFSFCVLASEKLLLSATFDRPWEPYMRIVWKDLGPVLDLVLCNCEGYDSPARMQGFERFVAWIRERQQESQFFYAPGQLTTDDHRYLVESERLARQLPAGFDTQLASFAVPDPVKVAQEAAKRNPEQALEQYLALLGSLHGLRELYPGDDEVFLRGAAKLLLRGFPDALPEPQRVAMAQEIAWFKSIPEPEVQSNVRPRPGDDEIQGGILQPFKGVTHGCVLLVGVTDKSEARAFLRELLPEVTTDEAVPTDGIFLTVAFTHEGLRRLGVSEFDLGRFPKEFREGMEARAGLLGDVRSNHPENWTLPEWNWPWPLAHETVKRVRLSTVDIVITLRKRASSKRHVWDWSPDHPLWDKVAALAGHAGIRLLSVQPTRLYRRDDGRVREHFGFLDGISQPAAVNAPTGQKWNDQVPLGDLLLGHANGRNDPPFRPVGGNGNAFEWRQGSLLDNGTFLVVRKLRQHVGTLQRLLDQANGIGTRDDLLAKMVGRTPDGPALADSTPPSASLNDFNYESDPLGDRCPFQAHIRRANPRTPVDGVPVPRIARRGMSYGPPPSQNDADEDRGMMFLAYNASIAEQFEVIQRWMTGGNSTGIFSGQADPLLRVPEPGDEDATMRIRRNGGVARIKLGDQPLVSLQWGAYLFVPAIAGLRALAGGPAAAIDAAAAQASKGSKLMESLKTVEDWSAALEDVTANRSGATSAIYAAVRARHGGALRTPFGVLVADNNLIDKVLNDDSVYSVVEYRDRMRSSIGESYLGMDMGPEYHSLAEKPNAIVQAVGRAAAFAVASKETSAHLEGLLMQPRRPVTLRLERVVDSVLAGLSNYWFDLPDGTYIKRGGRPSGGAADVHLPFHSLSPSRYIFSSPQPRWAVVTLGREHGERLLARVKQFVEAKRGQKLQGSLSSQLFAAIPQDDLLARTLVGMLEGFLPTVYGNLLKTLNLWLTDESLWRVQQDLLTAGGNTAFERARQAIEPALVRAMQARPVPDMIYRTATKPDTLGPVKVEAGERIVVGILSATESLASNGQADVTPVFGGLRAHPKHPTHACPAYEMGMGVMLGVLGALLKVGPMQPTAANLAVKLV